VDCGRPRFATGSSVGGHAVPNPASPMSRLGHSSSRTIAHAIGTLYPSAPFCSLLRRVEIDPVPASEAARLRREAGEALAEWLERWWVER